MALFGSFRSKPREVNFPMALHCIDKRTSHCSKFMVPMIAFQVKKCFIDRVCGVLDSTMNLRTSYVLELFLINSIRLSSELKFLLVCLFLFLFSVPQT